jgi:hypothetical protein
MRAQLRCRISAGQFSSECAVVVQNFNGRSFSLFAPKTELSYDEAPTDENSIEEWIAVEVGHIKSIVSPTRRLFRSTRTRR